MLQDAWLHSTGCPSCCGNVMETPESFQIQGTMATMQQLTVASICWRSLQTLWISAEIRRRVTFLLFPPLQGSKLQSEVGEWCRFWLFRFKQYLTWRFPSLVLLFLYRYTCRVLETWNVRYFLLHWNHTDNTNVPLSFRPFSSIVICSASSDSDSSMVWLPRSVWERRRLNLFIFSRELSGRGGLKTTKQWDLPVVTRLR